MMVTGNSDESTPKKMVMAHPKKAEMNLFCLTRDIELILLLPQGDLLRMTNIHQHG